MGVKDLWTVLSPVCEKRSLWELQGKRIAIDLSAWICDSQYATSQNNMYIRNIFFRTVFLLLLEVQPIFVLEGEAPEVKKETIRKRLKSTQKESGEKKVVRTRLASMQKQVVDMLSSLGISCVKAPGEAEAYCAHLNKEGAVHGVVTQDSDVFLYGAQEVYRNFQMAPNYTYDVYKMSTIEEKLSLTRNRLLGLSLLTGCDYTPGIPGIGKEQALRFVKNIPDELVTQKFLSWLSEPPSTFSDFAMKKFMSAEANLEMTIKDKALKVEGFPFIDVIEEFTQPHEPVDFIFDWQMPNISKFVGIAVKKLSWEEDYAKGKIFPLLARWHLLNDGVGGGISAASIVKKRTLKNVLSYEVLWSTGETSVEPRYLLEATYPHIVEEFEGVKQKAKKKKAEPKSKLRGVKKGKENKDEPVKETLDNFVISKPPPSPQTDELDISLTSVIEGIVQRPSSNPAADRLREKILKRLQ